MKPPPVAGKAPADRYVVLFGGKEEIVNESIVPYWEKSAGKEHNFDIDHVKEMQLGGDDNETNYELLDWQANRNSGTGIRLELLTRFGQAILTDGKPDPALGGKSKMDDLIAGGKWTVIVEDFTDNLAMGALKAGETYYWSLGDIQTGKHIELLRPLTNTEVDTAGLRGSESELVIYSSSAGGYPRRIPWDAAAKQPKAAPIENFYPGFTLEKVTYKQDAADGASAGQIHGKLFVDTSILDGQDPASTAKPDKKPTKPKTNFHWELRKSKAIEYGGYIDDTQVLPTLTANVRRAASLSPISFDKPHLDDSVGLCVTGQIHPSLSLLQGVDIDFMLSGEEVRVQKLFTAGDFNLPRPIQVTNAGLLIYASTSSGLGIKGDVNFIIDRLGKGHIGAGASTGKSLAESGFEIEGDFDFESKLFDKAHIDAAYKRAEGGDYAFSMSGLASIEKEGKVKGVKSAQITASYDKGKFTADGTAQVSIPGIQQANLHVEYDEKEGMVIGGEITLANNIPGIKSGSGKVTIKKKEGEEYHLAASGKVSPNIPGISTELNFSVDDDIFTVEGAASYEKGMLKGSLQVGVTNRPIDGAGKATSGKPGKDLKDIKVYGGGSLTLQLTPWLQGTAGVTFKPDGGVEVMGEIALPSTLKLFDERKIDKNLFKIHIDVPIFGVSALGQNIGIFATIGGGLDLSAGIGPGELQEARIGVTYDPADESKTHVTGGAKFHIPAHAGLRLFVKGGVGAGIPVVSASAGLEVGGFLGLEGALDAGVQVDWTPQTGIVLDAKGSIFVTPRFKFDISAFVSVDVDYLIGSVNLVDEHWQLAAFEWGSDLRFGVEMPIHYEEGKPFNVSIDDLKFTTPNIDPGQILGDLVKKVVG